MNQNQGNLTPEEIRQQRVEAEKAKIAKDYERKLFVIKHKKKAMAWLKMIGLALLVAGIIAGLTTITVRIVQFFSDGEKPEPEVVQVIDETEKPPADFAVKMTEIKLLQPVEGTTTYDVMARIVNENSDWGVSELDYTFILKDRFDKVVAEKKGSSYVLPNQSKHLIEVGINTERIAQKVELKIKMEQIQKLKQFTLPNMKVVDKSYQVVNKKGKVLGDVLNDSPYSFNEVEVGVILFDSAGEIIGLNFTNINSFGAGTKRSFAAGWSEEITGEVTQIYIEPQINIYSSDVFMSSYGLGQSLDY
ncbi:FxLYD domain-containing protein [Patescibacteria group bacterium]|nr:FxLYD domain-containing protein [Patescibacteria group bacterium]